MSTDYSRALGARLRAIRNQQGLSLQGVEDKSHGRWKAVVVGSYERGDRAVTVQRLSELAVFYGVPVSELLPDPRPSSAVTSSTKIVLNLESLGSLPADEAGPLARYASTIQAQRHDYNGKVLSIRAEDLKSLAIIYDMSPDELTTRLIEWGVLSPGADGSIYADEDGTSPPGATGAAHRAERGRRRRRPHPDCGWGLGRSSFSAARGAGRPRRAPRRHRRWRRCCRRRRGRARPTRSAGWSARRGSCRR